MQKITANNPLSKSADILEENIETLKTLFPEIVTEGKIDFKVLQSLLGNEIEDNEEYYRFTWAGKSLARQEANKPSTGTLRPAKEESKDWDTTQNIFIEGDNLEVLKLMQKSYAGKIKMIYIDPPYNTGKDFVYKDNYKDNLGNYLSITGQTDEEGKKLSTNTESDGRYHSNWLNMMYPRLKLARNLLKDDGVIFISIDDNEVANLRKICDELFGEDNFEANIVWQKKYAATNDSKGFSTMHDHIICYRKSSDFNRNLLPRTEEQNKPYRNDDGDGRGLWRSDNLLVKTFSASAVYPIVNPITKKEYYPTEGNSWRASKETMNKWIGENRIYWGKDSKGAPQLKRYLNEVQDGRVPTTWWSFSDVGHNDAANKELQALFSTKTPFDTPKPTTLLIQILTIACSANDIILDFFAGSSTTAHATMQMNSEDNGNRKFICVQLPETTPPESEARKSGFTTIAEISKERIRRAGEKIKEEKFAKGEEFTTDIGFRVFKLDSSNINAWDGELQNLEENLLSAAENIKSDRTEEDVLYEVLLKSGLDLAQPIEEKKMAGKNVFSIGMGALFICLANHITKEVAEGIGKWKETLNPATCRVIFRDTGFTDVEKTNSVQILKRYGIEEVNTI